jgi:lysophospholipase L1-like esterase
VEELIPELVTVWTRSSEQMNAICSAYGIRYLHCLQPNQYDIGAKPLSSEEKSSAFEAESPYRSIIEVGYPQLRTAGDELRAEGIAFYDLSRIFEKQRQTLYKDNCCHFNAEGNRIMADAIAQAIAQTK